jgi:uncharacterized protein (DUF952 family)
VTLIYHIALAADWERAQRDGPYAISTRGRSLAEEGFIHASTAEQVVQVADAFYRDAPDLVLLVIDTERVGDIDAPSMLFPDERGRGPGPTGVAGGVGGADGASAHDHAAASSSTPRRKSSWSRSRFSATVSWDAMCVMPDSGSTECGYPAASNAPDRRSV